MPTGKQHQGGKNDEKEKIDQDKPNLSPEKKQSPPDWREKISPSSLPLSAPSGSQRKLRCTKCAFT